MEEEEIAATEYRLTRALNNFNSIENSETQALIRLALRQGRYLSRNPDSRSRIDNISKTADILIESTGKIVKSWDEVNDAVMKLQKTYSNYSVRHIDSIANARNRLENFMGRVTGMTDILEGVLQEVDDQESATKVIEKLGIVREYEKKLRQSGPTR